MTVEESLAEALTELGRLGVGAHGFLVGDAGTPGIVVAVSGDVYPVTQQMLQDEAVRADWVTVVAALANGVRA